jgi:hypothetical protein
LHERLRNSNEELREATRKSDMPLEPVVARAANATAAANRTMEFVNYEFVRRTFRKLFPRLATGGLVVALGVGTFVFQTAQSPPPDQAVNRPIPVRLFLKSNWVDRDRLGSKCSANGVAAVAVGGTLSEPEVVTQEGAGCNATRLTITDDAGVAVPILKP